MKLDQVTETELSILQVIWEAGDATSRDIADALYDEVTDPKLASVQKLLERLEGKGCIERDRSERAHRFRSLISQEDYLQYRLRSLADRLCGGSIAPLMSTLLQSKGISKKEQAELRELIDQLWPAPKSSKKEGRK
jgi:BlaI family transcriptional regulator, penicillinase repressor